MSSLAAAPTMISVLPLISLQGENGEVGWLLDTSTPLRTRALEELAMELEIVDERSFVRNCGAKSSSQNQEHEGLFRVRQR